MRHLRHGLAVSVLGLGTVKFGRNEAVKYPQPFALPTDGEIANLLAAAKTLGINLLDTAPAYGSSEQRLGEAIAGQRQDWVLCTKVGEAFAAGVSRYDFTADNVLRSVARSLRRLRTDWLDMVLVHSDGRAVAAIEAAGAFSALRRLQREGVVRCVGFSGKRLADGQAALPLVDVLMCEIHAGDRSQVPLTSAAAAAGVGVLVKKPMASGRLAQASDLAATAGIAGVTSVIAGTLSQEHLVDNVAAICNLAPAAGDGAAALNPTEQTLRT